MVENKGLTPCSRVVLCGAQMFLESWCCFHKTGVWSASKPGALGGNVFIWLPLTATEEDDRWGVYMKQSTVHQNCPSNTEERVQEDVLGREDFNFWLTIASIKQSNMLWRRGRGEEKKCAAARQQFNAGDWEVVTAICTKTPVSWALWASLGNRYRCLWVPSRSNVQVKLHIVLMCMIIALGKTQQLNWACMPPHAPTHTHTPKLGCSTSECVAPALKH